MKRTPEPPLATGNGGAIKDEGPLYPDRPQCISNDGETRCRLPAGHPGPHDHGVRWDKRNEASRLGAIVEGHR